MKDTPILNAIYKPVLSLLFNSLLNLLILAKLTITRTVMKIIAKKRTIIPGKKFLSKLQPSIFYRKIEYTIWWDKSTEYIF